MISTRVLCETMQLDHVFRCAICRNQIFGESAEEKNRLNCSSQKFSLPPTQFHISSLGPLRQVRDGVSRTPGVERCDWLS